MLVHWDGTFSWAGRSLVLHSCNVMCYLVCYSHALREMVVLLLPDNVSGPLAEVVHVWFNTVSFSDLVLKRHALSVGP